MKKDEYEKKVKTSIWSIKHMGELTFINAGSICVGQVTDCVADEIVDHHNKMLAHNVEYTKK